MARERHYVLSRPGFAVGVRKFQGGRGTGYEYWAYREGAPSVWYASGAARSIPEARRLAEEGVAETLRRGSRDKTARDHLRVRPGGFNEYRPMFHTRFGHWIPDDRGFSSLEPARRRADAIRREGDPSRVEERAYDRLGQLVERKTVYVSRARPRKYPG